MSLFNELNAPFPYTDYEYNKEDGMVYIKGQAVAERLNEVLGVGYWSYEPLVESIKSIDTGRENKYKKPIIALTLLVKFSFYNKELKEWISFTDAGSQEMNARMGQGDATKSAITDGMKKCASRIGVASDLYKGKVGAENGKVILPDCYKEYYIKKDWKGVFKSNGNNQQTTNGQTYKPNNQNTPTKYKCSNETCNKDISKGIYDVSMKEFKKPLCIPCQDKTRKIVSSANQLKSELDRQQRQMENEIIKG